MFPFTTQGFVSKTLCSIPIVPLIFSIVSPVINAISKGKIIHAAVTAGGNTFYLPRIGVFAIGKHLNATLTKTLAGHVD